MMPDKNVYLTKNDMLRELHASKNTFCSYLDTQYADFHAIVLDQDQITDELIAEVVLAKATPKGKREPVHIKPEDVVVRVMTHSHIPLDPDRKRKARNTDQSYARTNFPPFRHFIRRDGAVVEVGRSHWVGGFENGHFSIEHGRINNRLGAMFILLVERISRRPNFRGYSYIDEMRGNALMQLSGVGLMFDESKSDNPFAFYTTAVNHSFVRVLNQEAKTQRTRDDLLQQAGQAPSHSRMGENDVPGNARKNVARPKTKAAAVRIAD